MDTLTHALSAALAARATQASTTKPGQPSPTAHAWAGFLAGAFPDSDIIMLLFGHTAYLNHHRGITHSLVMAPLWAVLLAGIFSLLFRRRYSWRAFYEVSLLAILVHIFGDVITNYGTMIFAPFSDYKLALSTTFIIDPYFTGIIVLALLMGFFSKRHKRAIAQAGFGVLLCYVLAQGWWLRMARESVYASIPEQILRQAKVYVLAQPLSPFNWKAVVALPDRYLVKYINLFRHTEKTSRQTDNIFTHADALYLPVNDKRWEVIPRYGGGIVRPFAYRVWQAPAMADIRRFMLLPAVQNVQNPPGQNCVWFSDQRFVLRGIRAPFIYGGCAGTDGKKITIMRFADGKPVPLD
ncbi:MAG: metal-dependent hydrolase [Gammaproteobacteria bacterium]|nr:metal-dependent hydrolase [Gammaproteobacteria bacterium]